ncbi:MAG: YcgN family cysteine cluster protein [Pseudomonadota bacterium]
MTRDAEGLRPRFWERVALSAMTTAEWEALCDGCGKCCVLKLEDEDTGEVHYTNVACRLFDDTTCRCGQYALRHRLVDGCVRLSPATLPEASTWMPETCAYRRLYLGQSLPEWHPLRTGDPDSPRRAGHSMQGRTVPEWEVTEENLEDHLVDTVRDCSAEHKP